MNGISLNKEDFLRLPVKEQNGVLFDNTEEIKVLIMGYKFHQKVQYIWLAIITVAVGASKFLGII